MSERIILELVLSYAPLAAVLVAYAWFARINRRWFAPANFYFGLPLTSVSLGAVLVAALRTMLDDPITDRRFIFIGLAFLIWIGIFWLQTHWRRKYQGAGLPAEFIFLGVWSNFLGASAYILLRVML
jgi:hypothetical protein